MIFVTVGTHEQQFNRLVEYADKIGAEIDEEVIVQTGYSTYEPLHCQWKNFYEYSEMNKLVEAARIVITHGGPSSFVLPIQKGKIPIVVPRRHELLEHINNHQVDFLQKVSKTLNIFVLNDYEDVREYVFHYDEFIKNMNNELKFNNMTFNMKFEELVNDLFA